MKKYFVLGLLLSFSTAFSQNFKKLLFSKKETPTIIINKNILGNMKLLSALPKKHLVMVEVLKPTQKNTDEFLKTYPNLSQYGFITATVEKFKIETRSQDDIRKFLGADPKIKIYADGFLLVREDYKFAAESIEEIEFIHPNEQNLNEDKIINVWTLTKERRMGDDIPSPRQEPINTILK